ncbi:alpha-2-macroglobulin [Rhodocytophaga aerolata]|uniref:Alpha-2-macroglobulin n=1 Tax=Rhodocytophaga aerolata TaxID=455078 RepID=A0ABT8RE95_9BACT|nr:alpha-2-macroglobulin [Rhodocytophaga aerolata]MDO1449050.1 alpha-2-macroglobulin [Rhodocytophaga aerolata]
MKTINLKFSVFLALLLVYACKSSQVEVRTRNFQEQVDLQQNLIFTFTNDLIADSLVNKWDTTAYIEFTPNVRGKFKWTSTNELLFSPDPGFRPSTDYQATLTKAVLNKAQSGTKLALAENTTFAFHTPYLALQESDMYWAKNPNDSIEIRLNLNFNYQVNPMEVANLLSIQIGGQKAAFKVTSSVIAETVSVSITQPTGTTYDDKTAVITIREGLKCAQSDYVSKKPMELKKDIPGKDEFKIMQVNAEYEGESGYIQVFTNQTVESTKLSRFITLDPATDFSVETGDFGFIIKGDFKVGSYSLKIAKNLRGIFGGTLPDAYEQVVVFGEMQPYISFASKKGLYLTSKGSKNIGVKIINVPKVRVTVYKIYENNILPFMRNNGIYSPWYAEGEYEPGYYLGEEGDNQYGDVVLDREVETKSLGKSGNMHVLNLELPSSTNAFKGIYAVKVSSTEDQWLYSTKLVSISDMGFMVKETGNEIHVFANSILTANPLAGVSVNLISSNNQSVYTAETDADGVARFTDLQTKAPDFNIQMITARQGDDFTYLLFNQNKVETSRYEVGGMRENPSGYQAFIYGERDIYRPGETVNLNTVIRNAQWKTVGDMPVKLKVLQPNGKEFTMLKGNLNSQSAFAASFTIPTSAVTGTYMAEVYTSNDVLLSSKAISIEEFIPDRIKVTVNLGKPVYEAEEEIAVKATALNLFGPPAANRNYEMTFDLKRKNLIPKAYADYTFFVTNNSAGGENSRQGRGRNNSEGFTFKQELRQGKTDAEGLIQENFTVPAEYKDFGILTGSIFTTVFDESGRPVNRMNRFDVLTQEVFYGIKQTDSYVSTNQPVQVPLIALNKDEKPLQNVKAQVQLIRLNWQTALVKNESGSYNYVSQKKEQFLEDKTITVSGTNTVYTFVPRQSGEYEVRIMKPGSSAYVSIGYYAYGYGYTENSSFEVDKEGQITMELDKPTYQVGDKAQILMKTPFAGKILVSIERNKVFEHVYVNTDKKSASVTIPIKEEYLPNVYITATLIKPVDDGAIPLTVAHGFVPVPVEAPDKKLPVELVAAAQSGSKTKQTITVKTKPNTEVTLAVVDEGILQLKNYTSPNPYEYFFQKRALEVKSYDLYPRLFPELSSKSSVGGDGYDLSRRVNPLTNKRVKLVAFWSGTLTTNGNGEAQYTVDIPQFSGDLRIMAVAYKDNAFGAASKNMKVADPVVISTSMPRFLSPGDKLLVPVTLTNTTTAATNATIKLQVKGGLAIEEASEQTVELPANSESQVQFAVNAAPAIGSGEVVVEVQAFNKTYTDNTDITIRPITSLLKTSGSGVAAAGTSTNVKIAADFIPATTQAKLVVSKSPLAQFTEHLEYLLVYPYGCVEQTTSGAFPQLYAAELSSALSKNRAAAAFTSKNTRSIAHENVQAAISRLQSMQMYNGALSYWPEGGYESWWGTTYAGHFLLEAKKAGFQVSEVVLDRMMSYLQQQVKLKKLEEYFYYNEQGTRLSKKIAPKEVAYTLYVLALAGEGDIASMNYYKSNKDVLALDSKYLLASTYLLLGDNAGYKALLPTSFTGERSVNAFGGSFYSYIRDEAIALNVLLETDSKNAQIPMMAKHLSEQMKAQKYLNTQERAFGLLALGKLAKKNNETEIKADLKQGNTTLASFNGEDVVLTKNLANKNITIQPSGSGSLYYFWQAEGLSETGQVAEEDSYLQVRKTFYNRFGKPISGTSFKQNDLVVVKITLSSTDGSSVQNVVITDMLPAGFEIENPRIADLPEMTWASNAATADHFDVRDDRINFFTTATAQTQTFYYVVRAVSKGTFKMGPVSADAMYNGEYHSLSGAGEIRVTEKGGEEL